MAPTHRDASPDSTWDRLDRIERVVFGQGVDDDGILTRLRQLQSSVDAIATSVAKHEEKTAPPTRAAVLVVVLGVLLSALAGWVSASHASAGAPVVAHGH